MALIGFINERANSTPRTIYELHFGYESRLMQLAINSRSIDDATRQMIFGFQHADTNVLNVESRGGSEVIDEPVLGHYPVQVNDFTVSVFSFLAKTTSYDFPTALWNKVKINVKTFCRCVANIWNFHRYSNGFGVDPLNVNLWGSNPRSLFQLRYMNAIGGSIGGLLRGSGLAYIDYQKAESGYNRDTLDGSLGYFPYREWPLACVGGVGCIGWGWWNIRDNRNAPWRNAPWCIVAFFGGCILWVYGFSGFMHWFISGHTGNPLW
jgi:hypothetical protein